MLLDSNRELRRNVQIAAPEMVDEDHQSVLLNEYYSTLTAQ